MSRTPLTYAVDFYTEAKYDQALALANLVKAHKAGYIDGKYYGEALKAMACATVIQLGHFDNLVGVVGMRKAKAYRKALRRKMGRVYTNQMNINFNYICALEEAAEDRKAGRIDHAKFNLTFARNMRIKLGLTM